MRTRLFLVVVLLAATTVFGTPAVSQGFMSFQSNGPTGTTVTTGEAGSYMRAGLDWDGTAAHVSAAGIAEPTLLSPATITTWRDASALHFQFSIRDRTTTNAIGGGSALACGEQVIIQIDQANAKAATLAATGFFRYDVVITNPPIAAHLTKRVPQNLGGTTWRWNPTTVTTTASVTTPMLTGSWAFAVTIPLADIGSPTGDIGIALALINDLGHSHVSGGITLNEATGTAFPATMGLLPESDPGWTACGAGSTQQTEDITGNWVKPNTWGTGYWAMSGAIVDVTFSQSPYAALSEAIRLGKCTVPWDSIPAVPSLSGWEAFQKNPANDWYSYNPHTPCRMGIWFNPQVSGAGVVNRRFLVVWGRPGIAPQDWYAAGVTGVVAISGSTTPVSFMWNNPPGVAFSDHPCLKVYVLPAALTAAESTSLAGITTQAQLTTMESTYSVSLSNSHAAQMNFANISATLDCDNALCQPLVASNGPLERHAQPSVFLASAAATVSSVLSMLQDSTRRSRPRSQAEHLPPRDTIGKSVRIIALGFGVADPTGNKPYVYVEPIGALGWAIPAQEYANASVPLRFEMNNPRVAETGFVRGTRVDIPAPPRRLLVALVTDVPTGTPAPRLDASALEEFGDRLVQPGEKSSTQITIRATHPTWWRWLLLILAVLIIIVLVLRYIRSRATP